MDKTITYEQPLNERIRSFLRMEFLFAQLNHYVNFDSEWACRNAITTLIEIVDFISRSDIKSELIKELERHAGTLNALASSPAVDSQKLDSILKRIDAYLVILRDSAYQPGIALRQNEFLASIKQRISIPGGSCNFDIPGYYYWLHKPLQEKSEDFQSWQKDLLLLGDSIKLSLQMIRNSNTPSKELAERGFYQKQIEANVACHLIRVVLPLESRYYPEISAGKHRFAIRFMEQPAISERPYQTKENVQFELHCCIL
jgi:cell division protein ZapD